jgi:hypothetical protein
VAHIVSVQPDQHQHLGVAWQNIGERVVQLAANSQGGKSTDGARTACEVGNGTAVVDRWREALTLTLRPLRNLPGSGHDQDEGHHG